METTIRKYLYVALWVILPTVIGAILSSYLNLAWIGFVSVLVSILLLSAYLFFHQRFRIIETIVTSLNSRVENELEYIREALGSSGSSRQLSWLVFWSKTQQLAAKIEGSDFDPDIVVSFGRSGSVVGGMIASILGSKPHIAFDRLVVRTNKPNHPEERNIVIDKTVLPNRELLTGKKLLCVMSECNTGNTLHVITEFFGGIPEVELRTAVIFCKPNVTCCPFFYVDLAEQWPQLPFRIEGKWKNYYPRVDEGAEI